MAGMASAYLGAAFGAGPVFAQEAIRLGRPGGILVPPHDAGPQTAAAFESLTSALPERPWVQVLRTFGNPVLEGHFAIRAAVGSGDLCLAMWDLGDRVLGVGQFFDQPREVLWNVLEVVMGRKPDIAIGQPMTMYESVHFETAHWRLDPSTSARIGREAEATETQARRWEVTSRATARAIEPLTRGLLPPVQKNPSHVLWHEPAPDLKGAVRLAEPYTLGGGFPGVDVAVCQALLGRRMLAPLEAGDAQAMLARNGGPASVPLRTPSGRPLGRFRILTV